MREFDVQVQCPQCGELVRIFPCPECDTEVMDEEVYTLYKINGCTKHNTEGLCQRTTFCRQCDYFRQAQLVHILHHGCVLKDMRGNPRKFKVGHTSTVNIQCDGIGEHAGHGRGMYPHNVLKAYDRNDLEWWKDKY